MSHRFQRGSSALLVIDVQERLVAAMRADAVERLINRTVAAIAGAKALGMPIIVTEQYPKGLGPTVKQVRDAIGADLVAIEKVEFSAWLPPVKQQLAARPNVLVTGHQAFFTDTALRNIAETTLGNVTDFEAGKSLKNEVKLAAS